MFAPIVGIRAGSIFWAHSIFTRGVMDNSWNYVTLAATVSP